MRIDLSFWMAAHVSEKHAPDSSSWKAKTSDYRLYLAFLSDSKGIKLGTLGHLTPALLRAFSEYQLDLDYAPSSVNRHLASLMSLSKWLRTTHPELKLPVIESDVFLDQPDLEPRSLSNDEIERLRSAINRIREPFQRERVSFCFEFLLASGLRRFELLSLTVAQIQGSWIRGVKGKGRKYRDVFLDDAIKEHLAVWFFLRTRALAKKGVRDGGKNLPLIINFRGVTPSFDALKASCEWLGYWFRHIALEGGVPDFSAHTLRHTRAQNLMDRTKDVALVASQLGHADLKTTMRYLERRDNEVEQKLRA